MSEQPSGSNAPPSAPSATHHQQQQAMPQEYYNGQQHTQQVPYAPYYPQAMPMNYNTSLPSPPEQTKAWIWSKVSFTGLCLLFGLILFGLSVSSVTRAAHAGYGEAWYALLVSIISILWNGAELITFGVRMRSQILRGIHPGAHVGLHLILWLLAILGLVASAAGFVGIRSYLSYCQEDHSSYSYSSYYDDYCSDYSKEIKRAIGMAAAMLAFWSLLFVCHFVLFVFACIDTRRRNMMKGARIIVYPGGAMPPPGAGYYYQQPPAPVAGGPTMTKVAPPAANPQAQPAPPNPALSGYYAPGPSNGAGQA